MEKAKENLTVDVLIPVYKPGKKFSMLISMLNKQSYPINRILIINTEEQYWKKGKIQESKQMEVCHIKKEEFDHGRTRHFGMSLSQADIVICMTDDAVPCDRYLVENLVSGFLRRGPGGERPAMVYARQLPNQDCSPAERYTRRFNYPAKSRVKTAKDLPKLGIKTYFASNVCCAYDRKIYEAQGGFIQRAIFNEDMIFACFAVRAGYCIVYQAGAKVFHSHHYNCCQQFQRNFDLGVSQADHPEVFADVPSEGEGVRLVKQTARFLIKSGYPWLLPSLLIKSGCKYLGYRAGKNYRCLPGWMVERCSMNRNYWKKAGEVR